MYQRFQILELNYFHMHYAHTESLPTYREVFTSQRFKYQNYFLKKTLFLFKPRVPMNSRLS
jgi:hypothetical protein